MIEIQDTSGKQAVTWGTGVDYILGVGDRMLMSIEYAGMMFADPDRTSVMKFFEVSAQFARGRDPKTGATVVTYVDIDIKPVAYGTMLVNGEPWNADYAVPFRVQRDLNLGFTSVTIAAYGTKATSVTQVPILGDVLMEVIGKSFGLQYLVLDPNEAKDWNNMELFINGTEMRMIYNSQPFESMKIRLEGGQEVYSGTKITLGDTYGKALVRLNDTLDLALRGGMRYTASVSTSAPFQTKSYYYIQFLAQVTW